MTQVVEECFCDPRDSCEASLAQRAEWEDRTVCEFEKLLTDHLHAHFKHAIKTMVGCGYKEHDAETIILRTRLFHGNRDIVSSILTSALASVNMDKEPHTTGYQLFENLDSLVKYTLLEMICALREVKPCMTILEAMWLIFVWDFNLSNACTKEIGPLGSSSQATTEQNYTEPINPDSTCRNTESMIYPIPKSALKNLVPGGQSIGLTDEPAPQLSKSLHVIKENLLQLYQKSIGEEFPGCSRKLLSGMFKHEMLWQKEFLIQRSYKGGKSKGKFKAKLMPLKSVSGSSGVLMKSSSSKISTSKGSVSENISHHKTNSNTPKIVKDDNFDNPSSTISSYYACIPYDTTLKKYIPQDEKDEAILELVPCVEKLQKIIQGWTDWAYKKFEQGVVKTQKVKAEMTTVQKEQEEAEKSQKNYHTKRHVEMEKAWLNAVAQLESVNSTLGLLETVNSTLSSELKSAECKVLESARDLQEALQQEQIVLKNSQSIDPEKRLLQGEFTSLKRNAADLECKLEKTKVRLKQFEDLLKKENKEKLKYLSEAETFRGRRKQLEAWSKAEEKVIRERSRCEIQKYTEKIMKLEVEITALRFESKVLRTGTPQTRTVMDYGTSSMASKNTSQYPGRHVDQGLPFGNIGAIDEKRERECVVCLAEERSVLFLPCAHQVVCTQCSMQHEKEMHQCPSCRTPIQKRIQVRSHTSD